MDHGSVDLLNHRLRIFFIDRLMDALLLFFSKDFVDHLFSGVRVKEKYRIPSTLSRTLTRYIHPDIPIMGNASSSASASSDVLEPIMKFRTLTNNGTSFDVSLWEMPDGGEGIADIGVIVTIEQEHEGAGADHSIPIHWRSVPYKRAHLGRGSQTDTVIYSVLFELADVEHGKGESGKKGGSHRHQFLHIGGESGAVFFDTSSVDRSRDDRSEHVLSYSCVEQNSSVSDAYLITASAANSRRRRRSDLPSISDQLRLYLISSDDGVPVQVPFSAWQKSTGRDAASLVETSRKGGGALYEIEPFYRHHGWPKASEKPLPNVSKGFMYPAYCPEDIRNVFQAMKVVQDEDRRMR